MTGYIRATHRYRVPVTRACVGYDFIPVRNRAVSVRLVWSTSMVFGDGVQRAQVAACMHACMREHVPVVLYVSHMYLVGSTVAEHPRFLDRMPTHRKMVLALSRCTTLMSWTRQHDHALLLLWSLNEPCGAVAPDL